MTQPTNNTATQSTASRKLIFSVAFLFFTFFNGFSQTNTVADVCIEINNVETSIVSVDTQIDFMNWFMSSKQISTSNNELENNGSSNTSRKKQIINSGSTPNKVLYRTFIKKIVAKDNAVA